MSADDNGAFAMPDPIVWLAILVEGGLFVLAWLIGWLTNAPPLALWQWNWVDAGYGLIATLPMLALFFGTLRLPWRPFQRIRQFTSEVIKPIMAPCTLLDLLGISVLAGLGEEFLFRGVFQVLLSNWTGCPWLGLLAAALLFGVMHAITPTYALFAALMGIFLGWVFLCTENLLVVSLAHALYDFIALVYLLRRAQAPHHPAEPPVVPGP